MNKLIIYIINYVIWNKFKLLKIINCKIPQYTKFSQIKQLGNCIMKLKFICLLYNSRLKDSNFKFKDDETKFVGIEIKEKYLYFIILIILYSIFLNKK